MSETGYKTTSLMMKMLNQLGPCNVSFSAIFRPYVLCSSLDHIFVCCIPFFVLLLYQLPSSVVVAMVWQLDSL